MSQHRLIRLIRDSGYEIMISLKKGKQEKSWSLRPNNLMSNDEIKKENQFKKRPKKRSKLNHANLNDETEIIS